MAEQESNQFNKNPQECKNHLLYQKDGFLARIILNRPEKYNAFSLPMINKWAEALQDAQEDQTIRVIVVTAKGKAFSTGGDVDAMLQGKGFLGCDDNNETWGVKAIDRKRSLTNHIHKIALTLELMDKPVICGINGMAIGAGLDMALMCDIRIAAADAQLSAGYVKAGVVPGDGGAFYMPRLVGVANALELLWTGEFISASEAKEMGMINKVVPAQELEYATLELAKKIAESPPVCVQMIKRAVYSAQRTNDLRTALDLISSQMAIVSEMSDHKEGLNALKEKRKPLFTGQ
ncbi:enoyl-CoA hydratase/carnithine racemase [Desulfosporosinus orientis DSM 765]|uniref:Enoyl-CoA hydratase/carnithine racemase n=1 Tax=Desulfosporosinus orientis (strain ATCC 19365 / DSM 765 / NCIMB 8382 / VKM B-1628 / Singapore I) TaxID=768706 RepID=G7WCT1_DESOD|nr:enoyl-CoA hydratase-related protein [Desulfosporosinus orientis]AET66837.1 enoyl-CoA hydratase/carnithine racemase [Desulfosporosinus orientis DSM 765]